MSVCADLGLFDDTCRHGMAGLYGSSDFSLYEEALLASTVDESVSVPTALSDRSPFLVSLPTFIIICFLHDSHSIWVK